MPEFNIFNTDRQLSALQTAVVDAAAAARAEVAGLLRQRPAAERRRQPGAAARDRRTPRFASNVALFPVDARGLVASAPLGDATRASPGGIGMFSGQTARQYASRFPASQDTLYALAKDTGGKAMFDYNDLSLGIVQAADALTSYYMLGYYSNKTAIDGKFHRVEGVAATAASRPTWSYRQGYYADKEFAKFTDGDKERQLEDALMLDNPVTEITIAMELNYFQLNRAEYFVPVAVKIPGSELALARRRGAQPHAHRLHRRSEGRLRQHDPERPRQAGHQAERRHGRAAGEASDSVRNRLHAAAGQLRASRCWRATPKPGASARSRRPSRSRT